MRFVKLKFVRGVFCSILNDYDGPRNGIEISETRLCVLHKPRVYTAHEAGPEIKAMNIFVMIRSERDEGKEILVGKVLLLFRCFLREI